MKKAWNLAKSGQITFGGEAHEYISESLKISWRRSKMENSTVKEITIQLIKASAKITAELHLEETVSLDGQKMTIPCCDITVKCEVSGQTFYGYDEMREAVQFNGVDILGNIGGKVGLTRENNKAVRMLVNEMKQHPAWIANEAKKAKNRSDQTLEYKRKVASGWCPKCGSYCYGDCEANG